MIDERIANEMLNQMCCIWPSMISTMSHDQRLGYIAQLVAGLQSEKLDNADAVRRGFATSRVQGGQYAPSVPEFIRWCKPEQPESKPQYKKLTVDIPDKKSPEELAEARAILVEALN